MYVFIANPKAHKHQHIFFIDLSEFWIMTSGENVFRLISLRTKAG